MNTTLRYAFHEARIIVLVLCLALLAVLLMARTAEAEDGSSVPPVVGVNEQRALLSSSFSTPQGMGGVTGVRIDDAALQPAEVSIAAGTTVVWRNTSNYGVRVHFPKGSLVISCKAPRGFIVSPQGSATAEIPGGRTATLCFIAPRLYSYEVSYLGASSNNGNVDLVQQTFIGTIEVLEK